jgi:predicted RNA-binding protein
MPRFQWANTATVGEPPAEPDGDVLDVIGGVIALARGLPNDPTIRTPLLHLYGRLTPMAGRIGALTIDGDLLMEDSATLVIETSGLTMTDRADITGTATLAGRVSLDVLTGYTPTIGDELTVMTAAGGFTGAMAGVDSVAPGSVRWRPEIVGTELHLVATCQADFIAPFGVLDFFDVQAFLNFYSAGDLNADLNADGRLDFFDLQAFLNVYSAGCS